MTYRYLYYVISLNAGKHVPAQVNIEDLNKDGWQVEGRAAIRRGWLWKGFPSGKWKQPQWTGD